MSQTKAQLLGPVLGDVNYDSGTLFVDSTNNRVGIGTDNPPGQLTLYQTNNDVYASTIRNYGFLSIQNKSTTSGSRVGFELLVDGVGNASVANISAIDAGGGSTDLAIGLRNSNVYQERLRITSDGKIGVNTSTPYAYDTTATTFEVKGSVSSATSTEVARFRGGSDANGGIAVLRLTNDNDRGLVVKGGRESDAEFAEFGTSSFNGTYTRAIRIAHDGDIGIGTDNPVRKLDVHSGNSSDIVQFTNDSGTTLTFGATSGMTTLDAPASTGFRFRSGGSSGQHFTISSTGNVGIGVTNPSWKTEILSGSSGVRTTLLTLRSNSADSSTGTILRFVNSTSSTTTFGVATITALRTDFATGYTDFVFENSIGDSLSETLRIKANGNIGIGTTDPISELMVENTTQSHITVKTSGSNMAKFGSKGNDVYIGGTAGAANIIFKRNIVSTDHPADSGTETVRIDSNGNLLINSISNNGTSNGGQTPVLYANGYSNLGGLRIRGLDTGNTIYKEDGDMSIAVGTAHKLSLKTNGSSALLINSTGNVGIGTTDPGTKLEIYSSVNNFKAFSSKWTASGYYSQLELINSPENLNNLQSPQFKFVHNFGGFLTNGYIGFHRGSSLEGGFLSFGSSGYERLRISALGNVGIGTTNPTKKLQVQGEVQATAVYGVIFRENTTVDTGIYVGNTPYYAGIFEVTVSGNPNHYGSGAYRASSTYMVHIGTGWTGSDISTIINATRISYGVGGSGNASEVTASFVLYNANNSTEYSSGTARSSQHQLRVKVAGTSTSAGCRVIVKELHRTDV